MKFVVESRVPRVRPRGRMARAGPGPAVKRVFHCKSQLADAPEIGLRDSARLLNCPDATDDTIGIYANNSE